MTTTIDDIKYSYAVEGLEDLPIFISGLKRKLSSFFLNKGKYLTDEAKQLLATQSSMKDEQQEFTREETRVLNLLPSMIFLTYGEGLVDVPENFTGNISTYVAELNKVLPVLYDLSRSRCGELNSKLSITLSNKSTSILHKTNTVDTDADYLTAHRQKLNTYFKNSSNKTKKRILDVFENREDIAAYIKNISLLNKTINKTSIEGLSSDVQRSYSLIKLLMTSVEEGDIDVINKDLFLILAEEVEVLARLVEATALIYHECNITIGTSNALIRKIKKDFR